MYYIFCLCCISKLNSFFPRFFYAQRSYICTLKCCGAYEHPMQSWRFNISLVLVPPMNMPIPHMYMVVPHMFILISLVLVPRMYVLVHRMCSMVSPMFCDVLSHIYDPPSHALWTFDFSIFGDPQQCICVFQMSKEKIVLTFSKKNLRAHISNEIKYLCQGM